MKKIDSPSPALKSCVSGAIADVYLVTCRTSIVEGFAKLIRHAEIKKC